MRVTKAFYRDMKNGRSKQTANYYIEFRDHQRIVRRMPAVSTRVQSEEIGRKIEQLVACRVAGVALDATLIRWVETLPPRMRRRLLKFDLLDSRFVGVGKPLAEHLTDFQASLAAKNTTRNQIALVVGRIRKTLDGCGFRYWSDISASRLQTWLAELRTAANDKQGVSIQTSNFYLNHMKQFCRWLHRDRRAGESPIQHLQGLNASTDRRHDRRALSFEEMTWLLDAAEKGPDWTGLSGQERALIYRVAAETGLRANELATLTVSRFTLDADPPTVKVLAGHSKHRHEDILVLKVDTAKLLKAHLANKMPAAQALRVPDKSSRTKILRRDLEDARQAWLQTAPDETTRRQMESTDFLCYVDREGRFADFHAFRHATGSFLAAAGVTPKVAQTIMRHSDINLTMTRYSHSYRQDEVLAVEKLPDLSQRPVKKTAS